MITVDEVRDFGRRFFDAVASGASAAEQAQFFLDPHARIYIAWNGATISLEDHETLHAQWINERHSFGDFDLTPLNASTERVRARFAAIPSVVPTASTWPPASRLPGPSPRAMSKRSGHHGLGPANQRRHLL